MTRLFSVTAATIALIATGCSIGSKSQRDRAAGGGVSEGDALPTPGDPSTGTGASANQTSTTSSGNGQTNTPAPAQKDANGLYPIQNKILGMSQCGTANSTCTATSAATGFPNISTLSMPASVAAEEMPTSTASAQDTIAALGKAAGITPGSFSQFPSMAQAASAFQQATGTATQPAKTSGLSLTSAPGYPDQFKPFLPIIDQGMKDHLQTIYNQGQAEGLQFYFSEVGDSDTQSYSAIKPLGYAVNLGSYSADLGSIYQRFTGAKDLLGFDSWLHISLTANSGWPSFYPIDADVSAPNFNGTAASIYPLSQLCTYNGTPIMPMLCEIFWTRPAFMFILIGGNDVLWAGTTPQQYAAIMTYMITVLEDLGIVPIVFTSTYFADAGTGSNAFLAQETDGTIDAITGQAVAVANALNVPVVDLKTALIKLNLMNRGLDPAGVHMNCPKNDPVGCFEDWTYAASAADFSGNNLTTYGMNLRNFLTMEVLNHVVSVVVDNADADPDPAGLR